MSKVRMKRTKDKTETYTRFGMMRCFLSGSWYIFAAGMIFAVLVSFLSMVEPRLITFVVDSVISDKAPQLPGFALSWLEAAGGVGMLRARPWMIAALIMSVALLAGLCRYLFRSLNGLAAETFIKEMRDRLFYKIEHLPYAWHGANSTGDIIQRCTSDVETIKVFVSEQLTGLIRVVVLIVLSVIFMAQIDPKMTLIASIFIPVVVGYSLFFYSRIASAFEKADEEEGRLSAIAQENLTGVRVVRAFGREMYERERFEKQNAYYTGFWIHLIKILTINWVVGDLMTGLQYILVIVMGSVFCVRGQITAGQFIAFVYYNTMLVWPVRSLGRVVSEMSKAGISLDRLRYIMNAEDEPQVEKEPEEGAVWQTLGAAAAGSAAPPDICFEHVSFSYPGSPKQVIRDVSLTIPAGTTLGILGPTGAGKSTLMYLLERLYPLEEGGGRITLGGRDIREIPVSELRGTIGMMQQESFLFSRSLKDNIAIAADDAGMDAVEAACLTADLLDTAQRFPSGFETFVGERGVTLSGGQKQRTAIAQTLIRECPVMIFDDALSAVDAETDERIRAALRERTDGATVIFIAHRVSTLQQADNIIVFEKGRITQQGTHEELLAQDGMYSRIYRLQTQEIT